MPFDIPDHDVSFHDHQSIWYSTDIDILAVGYNGVGVVDGCAVTAQGSPDMTVAIAAGNVRIASGAVVAVTAGNGTITTADGSNPRIDLVSVSEAGTKTVTAGTAASGPKPPDLPSGHVALAMVYVPASDTTIASNQITDKRVILSPRSNVQAFIGARVYKSGAQTLTTAVATDVTFDSERWDTDGFHSGSDAFFTIPAGMGGKYLIGGWLRWASNSSGYRYLYMIPSSAAGSSFDSRMPVTTDLTEVMFSSVYDLAAGDTFKIQGYHTRGSNLDISLAEMYIVKLDSGKVGSGIGARVMESTANQTIATDTPTVITFDEERFDTDGFHSNSVNTGRLTIPAGLGGLYVIGGKAYISETIGTTDFRDFWVALNGGATEVARLRIAPEAGGDTVITVEGVYQLAAGDYVELKVQHSSGSDAILGNTSVPAEFWLARLDSGSSAYTGARWGSGTAFPSGPATNDRFTRTDRNIDYVYDGTRWLCTCPHRMAFDTGTLPNGSTSADVLHANAPGPLGTYDWYVTTIDVGTRVVTTNNGSNYWKFDAYKATGTTETAIGAQFNTSADTVDQRVTHAFTVNAVVAADIEWLEIVGSKTSAPGAMFLAVSVNYRLIG